VTAPVIKCWKNTNSGGSTTTSLTIDKPTGASYDGGDDPGNINSGDLLIIICGNDDSTNTAQWDDSSTKPSGFNLLYTTGNSTIAAHFAVFYRVADTTEGTTVDVPSTSSNEMWASYICISGWSGDTGDLIVNTHAGDGTPTPLYIPAITITTADTLCIALAAFDGADSGGFTWTSPYTKREEIYSGSGGNDASGTWASRVMTGTGSTGEAEVTYVSTGDGMIGLQFGIPPASGLSVSAATTARTRTTNSTTVSKSRLVASATEARTRTVNNAKVDLDRSITTATAAGRQRSVYAATIATTTGSAAYIYLPEITIHDPRLLIPEQRFGKPTGPVQIDWTHPLSSGLAGAYLFRDAANVNYANGKVPTIVRASGYPIAYNYTMDFGSHANKAYFNLGIEDNLKVAGHYFGVVVGVQIKPISSSTDEHGILCGWSGISFRWSTWYERLEFYAATTGGSTSTYAGFSSTVRADFEVPAVCGATYAEDGYGRVFVQDGTTSTGSSTTGTLVTPSVDIYIGADPNNSTDNWQWWMHFMYVWNHGITVDVVNRIRSDPYQLFRPA